MSLESFVLNTIILYEHKYSNDQLKHITYLCLIHRKPQLLLYKRLIYLGMPIYYLIYKHKFPQNIMFYQGDYTCSIYTILYMYTTQIKIIHIG